MKKKVVLYVLMLFLWVIALDVNCIAQVNASFSLRTGGNVSFFIHSLNRISNGMKLQDYSTIAVEFEDPVGGTTYTGFAIYVKATTSAIVGSAGDLPLNRIKLTCTGNGLNNAVYVSDTSEVNSKLSFTDKPICYWKPGEGVSGNDVVKVSYFIESLLGEETDIYDVDIRFEFVAYETVDP